MTQKSQNNTILVFGAGGRLGRLLRQAWHRVPPAGMIPLFQSRPGASDFRWQTGQSGQSGQTSAELPQSHAIIALWGKTSGTAAELSQNSDLARESLAAARASGAKRVLHFSSAAIYGPAKNASEATAAQPVNDYGRSKLAMEQVVAGFAADGIHHCCLRLANVVGADSLAPALRSDQPVRLDRFADGRGPQRSYIGMGHLAQVLAGLAALPPEALPPVLNVTAPHPVEMQALAEAAGKTILWQDAPGTAIQQVTLDGTRLSHLLPDVDPLTSAGDLIADWQELERRA